MLIDRKIEKKHTFLTFIIVSVLWVLFSSDSIGSCIEFFKAICLNIRSLSFFAYYDLRSIIIMLLSLILVFVPKEIKERIIVFLNERYILKYSFLLLLLVMSISFVVTSDYSPFLYFGF